MRKDRRGLRLPEMSVPVPAEPWEFVSVDVMGPFVKANGSGNKFVVVFSDHLTRYVETMALKVQDTKSLARCLVERVMCRHGCPRTLLSDRGLPFLSELAHEVYRLLRVRKLDTAGYRPQTNGLVERFNQTFATMLSMYVNSRHTDWDIYLPYLTFAYNTGTHPAIKETPFYLVHGREPRLPLDVTLLPPDTNCRRDVAEYRDELVEGLTVAREYSRDSLQREQQRRAHPPPPQRQPPVYKPGEQVMVRMETGGRHMNKKLQLRWAGPFRVVRSIGGGGRTYGVKDNRGVERPVNALRMKRFEKHPHPTTEEADYADHLTSTGEALVTEGNREADGTSPDLSEGEGDDEVEVLDDIEFTPATQVLENEAERGGAQAQTEEEEAAAGDGDGSQDTRATRQARTWSNNHRSQASPASHSDGTAPTTRAGPSSRSQDEDLTPRGLRLRGTDADGGASQLCGKCHAGRKGHRCSGRYQPARQAVVNERRRGKDPDNNAPFFGIAMRKRGGGEYTYRGVFAPYDLRVMEGEIEKFEDLVRRQEGREAKADDWNDYCESCNKKGGVVMCLGCNLVYHEKCLVTRMVEGGLKRNEELLCPGCVQELTEPAN